MRRFDTNQFSLEYYESILKLAISSGYVVTTLEGFWRMGCPDRKVLALRHDVDVKPHTLKKVLDAERSCGCRSSVYVRVAGAPYNLLDYPVFKVLKDAEADGFSIGLHTNYAEFAEINSLDPMAVLTSETSALRSFFPSVSSLAPHRDHSYVVNSLPHLKQNWSEIVAAMPSYEFQAYDDKIMSACEYVNEGYELHLSWRKEAPECVIPSGRSIVMMTHSHWWYSSHPFEE